MTADGSVLLSLAQLPAVATKPAVSVIIPTRDSAPTLARTLESLRDQQLDEPFEVIVVDDGSRDGTAELVLGYEPLARVIRNERSEGPGAARNRGVAAARGQVLAFTDADCFPSRQWLARGLEALVGADLVQGRVAPDPTVARSAFDRTLSVDGDGGFYQTANLLVRREVFERVGGFRDWALEREGRRRWSSDARRGRASRTPIGEDTLFAWTARRLGARSAYAPEALVHHAVVPGGFRDDVADRWHWTRDMPGLVRLVPELRRAVLYRRVFFSGRTARFDLAVVGAAASVLTGRARWLLTVLPYVGELRRAVVIYEASGPRDVATVLAAASIADAASLVGFLAGSLEWRSLVI
jgi:glycosyltransferase involved in cell wall biosynthesis